MGQNPPSTVDYMCHVFILKIFVFWWFWPLFFCFSSILCKVIIGFGSKSNRLWARYEAICTQNLDKIETILYEKNHFEEKLGQFYCDLDLWRRGSRSPVVNRYPSKLKIHTTDTLCLYHLLRYQKSWKKSSFTYDVIVTSYDVIFEN